MAFPNINLFAFRTYSAPIDSEYTPFNSYTAFQINWWWLSYGMPSANQIAEYYANLLIIQYLGQPKAYETMIAMTLPVIMDQLPLQLQNGFNLTGSSPAIGNQLNVIGSYVGVTRNGYGLNGPVSLSDADFLKLIQMGIIRNSSRSSLAAIQSELNSNFPNQIYVFDYQNMNMSYLINTSIGNQDLVALFVTEKLLPRPMGVGLSVIVAPVINEFFGLRNYQAAASSLTTPFNSYTSYNTAWLSMTYADSIPVPTAH